MSETSIQRNTDESVLKAFYSLAELDATKRLAGTQAILKAPMLDVAGSLDQTYVLKRLIRGLSSSRGAARQGFATTLTSVLRTTSAWDIQDLLKQLHDTTTVTKSMRGHEGRDMTFGRLFGYMAMVRSGKCNANVEVLTQLIEDTLRISKQKLWMSELAIEIVCDALENASEKILPELFENLSKNETLVKLSEPNAEWTTADVCLGLVLAELSRKHKNLDKFSAVLPILAKVDSVMVDRLVNPLRDACHTFPRVHSVWSKLIPGLLHDMDSFKRVWSQIIIEEFVVEGSHERKYAAMKVFESVCEQLLTQKDVNTLTEIVMDASLLKCFLRNASSSKHILHTHAVQALASVAEMVSKSSLKEHDRISIVNTLRENGLQKMDSKTKAQIVNSMILGDTDASDVNAVLAKLASIQKDLESQLSSDASSVVWALNAMYSMVKPIEDIQSKHSALVSLATYLFKRTFFVEMQGGIGNFHVAAVKSLESVLGDAVTLETVVYNRCVKQGTSWENEAVRPGAIMGALWEVWVECESKNKCTVSLEETEMAARDRVKKLLKKLGSAKSADPSIATACTMLLQFLCMECVILEVGDVEVKFNLVETIEDVCICTTQFCKLERKTAKLEDPMTVLVDALVGALAQESSVLRTIIKCCFGMLSHEVNPSALGAIMDSLLMKHAADPAAGEQQSMKDEDGDDHEEEEEGDSHSEDEKNESVHKHDTKKDDNDDAMSQDEDDQDSDDANNNAADKALGAFVASKIAARTEAKSARHKMELERLHIKLRALDLIDTYIKVQPKNPLLVLIALPLMRAGIHCLNFGGEFKNKATEARNLFKRISSTMQSLTNAAVNIEDGGKQTFELSSGSAFGRQVRFKEEAAKAKASSKKADKKAKQAEEDEEETIKEWTMSELLDATLDIALFQAKYAHSDMVYSMCEAAIRFVIIVGFKTNIFDANAIVTKLEPCINSIVHSKNGVKLSTLVNVVTRLPMIGWSMLGTVCELSLQSKTPFILCEVFDFAALILKQTPKEGIENPETVTPLVSKALVPAFEAIQKKDDKYLKEQRVKSIVELANTVVRFCKLRQLPLVGFDKVLDVAQSIVDGDLAQKLKNKFVQFLGNASTLEKVNDSVKSSKNSKEKTPKKRSADEVSGKATSEKKKSRSKK